MIEKKHQVKYQEARKNSTVFLTLDYPISEKYFEKLCRVYGVKPELPVFFMKDRVGHNVSYQNLEDGRVLAIRFSQKMESNREIIIKVLQDRAVKSIEPECTLKKLLKIWYGKIFKQSKRAEKNT